MRVLLIPNAYPPVLGGVQTVTHYLAQHLMKKGHEVLVVTNHYPRPLPVRERLDGVPIERLLFLRPDISSLQRGRLDLFLTSFYFYPSSLWRLRNIMRSFRPDILNVHFPDHQIPFVRALWKGFNVRLVVSLHGHDIERVTPDDCGQNGNRLRGRRYPRSEISRLRSILRETHAVTACSQYLLDRAIQFEPSIAGKGRVIHNGIDPMRFRNKKAYVCGRPYILALGRLVRTKGFDMLLAAFAQIKSGETVLMIAGEGEEREALENQTHQLGLEGRVHFFGSATPEQAVALLNGSLLVVIPSRSESFGIVALEALAAGKPVLATRVGGLAELITQCQSQPACSCSNLYSSNRPEENALPMGQLAMLVEPNVAGLARGLRTALQSNLGCEFDNKSLLDKYTWERVASDYETVMSH